MAKESNKKRIHREVIVTIDAVYGERPGKVDVKILEDGKEVECLSRASTQYTGLALMEAAARLFIKVQNSFFGEGCNGFTKKEQ